MNEIRKIPITGILQEWVAKLGLRHQGVLVSCIRGCDTAPKDGDPSKNLSRALRGMILNTHCANPQNAKSYIEYCTLSEITKRQDEFRKNTDHYPHHFIMHIIHASEIIGYKHPDSFMQEIWMNFYIKMCKSLHMNPETEKQMDQRLNADEESFYKNQQ